MEEQMNESLTNELSTEMGLLSDTETRSDVGSPSSLHKIKHSASTEELIGRNKRRGDYAKSFTVHGLTRICTGTRPEAAFWLFMVTIGLSCGVFVIYRLVTKYLMYEIYTEIHQKLTTENYFPSITFCDKESYESRRFQYCGIKNMSTTKFFCDDRKYISSLPKNNTSIISGEWGNGLFRVVDCVSWGSIECKTDNHLKSLHRQHHACFTWNYRGDFHDPYSHVSLVFKIDSTKTLTKTPTIVAHVHESSVEEIDPTNRLILEPRQTYELKIRKSLLKRLPEPFPSKCVVSFPNQIFPGKYTRRNCIESEKYMAMLKKCGDVYDYHRSLIPRNTIEKYKPNITKAAEVISCISEFSFEKMNTLQACPFPCTEIDYYSTATSHGMDGANDENSTFIYRIEIQLQNVDSYRVIEEKQLYTWDQVLGETGGSVGLIIGASIISIIEILAYIYLCLVDKCYKLFKKYQMRRLKTINKFWN